MEVGGWRWEGGGGRVEVGGWRWEGMKVGRGGCVEVLVGGVKHAGKTRNLQTVQLGNESPDQEPSNRHIWFAVPVSWYPKSQ